MRVPQVSIVIPVKDRRDLVAATLNSLQAQTSPDWEAVVVDDGSTDGTLGLVASVAAVDPRVKLLRRQGSPGGNCCRNEGMRQAVGEWLIFLDSDDLLSRDCVAGRLAAVAGRTELDFAVFPHDHFEQQPGDREQPFHIPLADDYSELFLAGYIPWQTAGPMWRRRSLPREQVWDEELASGQDPDFNLKALLSGSKCAVFSEPRFFVRMGSNGHQRVTMGYETPRRVMDGECFVTNIWNRLKSNDQLTDGRILLLARRHLMLAEQWLGLGYPERASQIWTRALERSLITQRCSREGRWFLRMWNYTPVRRALRLWLAVTWPAEMQLKYQPPIKGFCSSPGRATSLQPRRSGSDPSSTMI